MTAPDAACARRPAKPATRATFSFARDIHGRTYLSQQFAGYPFHVTRPFYVDEAPAGMATLYLQHLSGGVFQHDRLRIDVRLAPGSAAHLTTQASTKVHGMTQGHAEQRLEVVIGADAFAEIMLDPLILFPGACLRSRTRVTLGPRATAILGESFLRHDPAGAGEAFDWLDSETRFAGADGGLLTIDRFRAFGEDLAARHPGVAGDLTMHGTLFVVGVERPAEALAGALRESVAACDAIYAGASILPGGGGAWLRVLAADGAALREALRLAWSAARALVTGTVPIARRK